MKIDKQTLEGKNVHVISTNHDWTEFVSDELKDKLLKLKSDNGMVPLGTVDEIIQLFVNDIEKLGKEIEKLKSRPNVEYPTNVGG